MAEGAASALEPVEMATRDSRWSIISGWRLLVCFQLDNVRL
jgi:hypothetical protein